MPQPLPSYAYSPPHVHHPSTLLLFLLYVLHPPLPIHATNSFTCSTPTTLTFRRLPAIIEVENRCQSTPIALCLEYSGTTYLIRTIQPHHMDAIPTVHLDCWVLRLSNKEGPVLHAHSITGSHKLSADCNPRTPPDPPTTTTNTATTNLHAASPLSRSVGLDCALTIIPTLRTTYHAALSTLTAAAVTPHGDVASNPGINTHLRTDETNPFSFVRTNTFLQSLYLLATKQTRRGIPARAAFAAFDHARALTRHIQRCRPYLTIGPPQRNAGVGTVAIPAAYLAMYGVVAATLWADARKEGTWRENRTVADLTAAEASVVLSRANDALADDVPIPLPGSLYPPAAILNPPLISTRTSSSAPGQYPLNNSKQLQSSIKDAYQAVGERLCGEQKWRFWRLSLAGGPPSDVDCCWSDCFLLDDAFNVATFSMHAFVANCCMVCNRAVGCRRASQDATAEVRAALEGAEVHVEPVSDSHVAPPVRMIEVTI